ncbi:MAG TPA: sigma 54-interacting transcriptional regulator [Vicinamibacterales bacterium]|nr:sigma 54-interacting transcriptional regulator [Acidobacteriota bacterium]HOC19520.1 sigma 54-interacting transcriptional regulator [Vicinamibacterales bacterium]
MPPDPSAGRAPRRDPHLAELLDFRPDQGIIRLHEQRVLVLSAAAMGLLRKELIDTFGLEASRRVLLRFGFADGYHDAVNLRARSGWTDPLEGVRSGALLHTLEGLVRAEVRRIEHDAQTGRFEQELVWHDSYEAEQHVHHYGKSRLPVCWSLAGYASGFVSACLGTEIYFREVECAGTGAARCVAVGRDAAGWAAALQAIRADFQAADLGREVERLREAVHARLRELGRRERLLDRRERELNVLRGRVERHAAARHFVARSQAMRDVLELAARVAPLDTTVLVQGESGTGKEFVVRMIHDQSPRAAAPFVSINCAALTETLLESELFGHVRGAFTGAVRDKAGLFEVAGSGTIFLDEIGDIAPTLQAKLLRALQEREIRRVGAERAVKVRARVVAATNRDLRAAVEAGRFREDLYFRLAAFVIAVPPLRERTEDIPPLVQAFLSRAASRMKKDVKAVSAEAMSALMAYRWPGNIRELEHAVERAVILANGPAIRPRDLPPEVIDKRRPRRQDETLDIREREKAAIERALERFAGNRRKAAAALGISTVTLWRRMKQYGLS